MRAHPRRLSVWYQQLARELEAGRSLIEALEEPGPDPAIARTRAALLRGVTPGDAWREAGSWLPAADVEVLGAGALSGQTPALLRALATRHAATADARTRLLLASLYPVTLLHLAALVLPLRGMIDWETGFVWRPWDYARGVGAVLVPVWVLLAGLGAAARSDRGWLHAWGGRLPVFGRYLRRQALADLALVLGHLLRAGVPLRSAWQVAGRTTRWPALQAAAAEVVTTIDRGEPPGRLLPALPLFPREFVTLYRTGETTGGLDDVLLQLHGSLRAEAARALVIAVALAVAVLFLIVAGLVVATVVQFYSDYLRGLEQLVEP